MRNVGVAVQRIEVEAMVVGDVVVELAVDLHMVFLVDQAVEVGVVLDAVLRRPGEPREVAQRRASRIAEPQTGGGKDRAGIASARKSSVGILKV